ncbi:hypothetical protein A0H81_13737 [Grifola frondosa]|uniref:Uncharacterized protein n=1 Tax=Grifola frondosa TaxID=5627 RepID=A0A1C7LQD9_GRIFR|nr:hypothetical protein A0H81_13737 [Grifola frondosa]
MSPPTTPLPSDVLALMHHTMELVELLYWKPVPTKGSAGEQEVARTLQHDMTQKRNLSQSGRSGPVRSTKRGVSGEREMAVDEQGLRMEGELDTTQFPPPGASRHQRREWWINTDLETRMAYGRALMSGHDYEYYDPALFEDTVPLDDSHLYSEPGTVEAWQRGVTSTDEERQA